MTNSKLALCLSISIPVSIALAAGAARSARAAPEAPVVGGHLAMPGEWPDVALVVAPKALCTGTLVAPDVVVTAGHCIETQPFEVILGITDFTRPGGERIAVARAVAYPDWRRAFDVGVLVLEHPSGAKPRALASACTAKEHLADGVRLRVVGFGLTTASGTGDNTELHEADLQVTDAACTRSGACNPEIAPGGELAAGGHGTDSCFGDSGGPAFVATASGPALLGIVSRGEATSGAPCADGGVYERADRVGKWIETTTGRALAHAPCDNKADDDGPEPEHSGCSASGELAGGGALLLLVGMLWVYNSRACRKSR